MPGNESDLQTISRLLPVYYDTYANLPTTNVPIQALGYATDRKVMYRWSGAAWQALSIYCGSGAAAAVPTAADLPEGSLYFETDTSLLKQVQSGAWATIGGTVREVATGSYTGNDGAARQITVGFKCSHVMILADNLSPARGIQFLVAGQTHHIDTDTTLADDTANCYIHASDGFVVDLTGGTNSGAQTYYYWAISE